MISKAKQTQQSFHDKWSNNTDLAMQETLREGSDIQQWILKRNGWNTLAGLRSFLSPKHRVLDAGCGNGRVTRLLRLNSDPTTTEVVGVDLVAAPVAAQNLQELNNVKALPKDLLGDLSDLERFDFIYCQEVLHHTSDPERAFRNLVDSCLAPDGTIAIYVYKKKAVLREHADDHIREKIKTMDYHQAMKICEKITELGRNLSKLDTRVTVPDIPVLDIKGGEYDIQRFIYHFFFKCFWNDALTFEENTAINYDWYHPELCYRYQVEDIEGWFQRAGLEITHTEVDYYGITMHGSFKGQC